MEFIGWSGTALVIVAYLPQIHHLLIQKCAWGISVLTWTLWLFDSTLLLVYCLLRRDYLFMIVQSINIAARGRSQRGQRASQP